MPPLPLCCHRLSSARGPLYTQWHLSVAPRKSNRAPTGHRRPQALFQARRCCAASVCAPLRKEPPVPAVAFPHHRQLTGFCLGEDWHLPPYPHLHWATRCLWRLQPRLCVNYRWPVHTLAAQLLCWTSV